MTATETTTTVVVPGTHLMAALVGPRDQHLRQIEQRLPDDRDQRAGQRDHGSRRAVRRRSAASSRSWSACSQRGHELDEPQPVDRVDRHGRASDERPTEVLTQEVLRGAKGRQVRPKTAGQKRYVDAIAQQHHHVRHRPGRHRQVVAGGGDGGPGAAGQAGPADHPHPPGGRGRRAARLPARRPDGQDRPVPAPALRRPLRHGRAGGRAAAARARARSRSRRWRSCAAARSTTASSSSTRRRTRRPSR